MSILRSYGEVQFHCDEDGCHNVLETETKDWQIALSIFKESDWAIEYSPDPHHICPDCLEELSL